MTPSLLPPNATPLERAAESATARIGDVPFPVEALGDPQRIPLRWLPWLAWGLSVDSWDDDWSEAEKRAAVAGSIALHRIKGTRASVETVLGRFDQLLHLVEWHQAAPRADPHTFEVRLPIAGDGVEPGGRRATAAFAEAIIREVSRVKPAREHFRLVQTLGLEGAIGIQGVARLTGAVRQDMAANFDTSPAWAAYLQTEDGEPLQEDSGAFLDTAP
ncbi:phage tail protein I [Sphingomonas desiccabilis]|uniref:Phage tail protein I n=1 Tax=Sphingomonas desiccabilis TaxID=429134 RepID=A0A4Q2IWP3_9SPHN|nr:phage tail protein I [Sphingomonas desiccabilis]MBB3910530.1 phage tail P2-like protein [Sphingomonas desiccabilis]RXZ35169.1 phage tail protein I [Sphingomonas desiccabilis]